ncbi:L-fucose dehydrogenase [Sphingobacterium allocomposti]|uniref:L-fucose dehydrogenase n=1 Tax=Sphingobacterium allocomposti TaxID=415956 RepID=A0A5S5DLP1_9SPHI|nr:SDR family oxidoreductase [Sphingobacterium composti Yoo et al. 2007 non Ten et al. 2007]TYP96850.1 L-fucose dehydrogenase [Sphingobacterium composti Yoo et al. 2007 non Ten et al. 2007]HLS96519.1 SDR family oxidoreductase [Sphingobacterium sp.]
MDLNLKDKVVIVTGGAKGIGRAVVIALAKEGAIPVIVGRKKADNERVREEVAQLGANALAIEAELSIPEACKQAVEETLRVFGRIDGLVNNAGHNDGVGLISGNYERFVDSLHKNLIHYYLMAHHCIDALRVSRGSIVNISSKTAETGQGNTSAYAASNGGRNALTREWAVELLPYSIRVNAVIVAECATPQYDSWIQTLDNPAETLKKITDRIPLEHRMTTPEEIANTAVFLLSDKSSHTTGQLIHVDGGYVHLDRSLIKE